MVLFYAPPMSQKRRDQSVDSTECSHGVDLREVTASRGLGLEGRAQFFVNLSRESRVSKILCRRSAGSSDCGPRPSHRTPAYASLSAILSPVLLASERTSWCSILLCEWRVSHDWGFRLATPFFGQFLADFFCSPDRVLIVFEGHVACAWMRVLHH